MENDRTPYTSNVTTAPYNLSGSDSLRQESSLTNTIGIAKKSKVASANYSKGLSGSLRVLILICVDSVSLLSDLR